MNEKAEVTSKAMGPSGSACIEPEFLPRAGARSRRPAWGPRQVNLMLGLATISQKIANTAENAGKPNQNQVQNSR